MVLVKLLLHRLEYKLEQAASPLREPQISYKICAEFESNLLHNICLNQEVLVRCHATVETELRN
jgi:hypothetical protein